MKNVQFIEETYKEYHHPVYLYICRMMDNREEAEDLAHDVFVRLMDYGQMLRPDTVKSFLFTVAHNLACDSLRRRCRRQEMTSYIYEQSSSYSNETESRIIADDLVACEQYRMSLLPPRRRTVYQLSRFEEQSPAEISARLNISPRTAENLLRLGRQDVRAYMKQCI